MRHPFWSEGLRPFFLLGAAFAALSIPLWVLLVSGAIDLPLRGGALAWHVHETLFGFVAAAMAGFLTTAVPQWTGAKPIAGAPLALLVLLWLAGRAAWIVSGAVPGWLVAAIDIAFLPALCCALGASIVRVRQWRNLPVIVLVSILALANAAIHAALLDLWADGLMTGARLGLLTAIVLVSLIGGRIVPAFTRNALVAAGRPAGNPPHAGLAAFGNIAVAAAGALIVLDAPPIVAGPAALAAAGLAAVRLAAWRGWQIRHIPLLWVLHLAWLWVPAGLALYGLALLDGGAPESAAIHALSVGAAATMVMAVSSRAALGHTGRALVAPRPMVGAYLLLTLSAITRVLAALDAGSGAALLHLSAACWSAAFALFFLVYLPILTRPRVESGPALDPAPTPVQ
ncbi:MAG: NnrS family protein [Rhodospirillaceae bacterium]|nr:NnrS family protein [Rhodospirillaceae bacterium]